MGQKDLTQKHLESYPDVFADVINALLYEGKEIVKPEELQPAPTETFYRSKEGRLRNQFQDVSKYEVKAGAIRVQYAIENETSPNGRLVLRKAGYAGAIYREQYDGKRKPIYPFVSVALYWGKQKRRIRLSLHSLLQRELPEEIRRYVDDTQLYIYSMRELAREVRERFRSDMRLILDYLAEGADYQPGSQPIVHLEEFILFLGELSGDERYKQILSELDLHQEGEYTMCELLDKYINKGIQQGMRKGVKKGIRALVETCQEFGLTQMETVDRVMQKFSISQDESIRCTQKYWNA